MHIWGKGWAAGWVGSDFLSAIVGRVGSGWVNVLPGRVPENGPVDNSAGTCTGNGILVSVLVRVLYWYW